jgi:hypothetical protein
MNTFKGIITIIGNFSGSKSDGFITYLIAEDLRLLRLYRPGVYETNDKYFFPFQRKYVEVRGKIQKDKWIEVEEIMEIPDPLDSYHVK